MRNNFFKWSTFLINGASQGSSELLRKLKFLGKDSRQIALFNKIVNKNSFLELKPFKYMQTIRPHGSKKIFEERTKIDF